MIETTTANASPEKGFFIRMITRDIALDSCILDLLDNSLDGSKRILADREPPGDRDDATEYAGFRVAITLAENEFRIHDNCGGIPLDDARDYAFHFGRPRDEDREPEESIGIYGIGMKRALFKIGRQILVESSTTEDAFVLRINVPEWERDAGRWNFPLDIQDEPEEVPGTTIYITELNEGVGQDFADTAFVNRLRETIARDYAWFLQRGLTVSVNDGPVVPWRFSLLEGGDFLPAKIRYEDNGVEVELSAGMAKPPPEDDSATADVPDRERYGWFVLCNDRVVLAGDKTEQTVWGVEKFPTWHYQYNGFLGIARFRAADASKLPWTTTKRGVDHTDPVYRRATRRMRDLTRPFIDYTNARKANVEEAAEAEKRAKPTPVEKVAERKKMGLPKISKPRSKYVNVQYRKPTDEVERAAEALGKPGMPATRVGRHTFDYFYKREVGE